MRGQASDKPTYLSKEESFMYDREANFPMEDTRNDARIEYTENGMLNLTSRRCELLKPTSTGPHKVSSRRVSDWRSSRPWPWVSSTPEWRYDASNRPTNLYDRFSPSPALPSRARCPSAP